MVNIIDGAVRMTFKHVLDGSHNCDNVWDWELIDSGGTAATRAAAILSLAQTALHSWATHVMPNLGNDIQFTGVTWVDLDSDSGSTGSITTGGGTTLPVTGGFSGGSVPANTAVLIRKATASGRGTRPGRLYLAGFPQTESASNNEGPTPSVAATIVTALQAFMSDTGYISGDVTTFLGVAHDKAHSISPITAFSYDATYATQRRRLRK